MKGKHRVVVQNKRIRYDFEVRRNLTVIRGDSATGKTTLVDMIREYFENGSASAIELLCDKQCAVIEGRTWQVQLSTMQDSIIFIDEGNDFVTSREFASAIKDTDNYYVIVTREGISTLPYSVDEIYGIRNSGKYGTLKRTYQELFHLYERSDYQKSIRPRLVIAEDSNSGYEFFSHVCEVSKYAECISAKGKSNVFSTLVKFRDQDTLVIADGAAFGSEMEKIVRLMKDCPNINLYLPESFEWLILKAGVIDDNEIASMLEHPEEEIESRQYFSWERYFTEQLIHHTDGTYLKYTKKRINPVYVQDKVRHKILGVMQGINFGGLIENTTSST